MMRRRSGYALIELLAVLAAAAAVTGVAVGTLALGYRIHRAARVYFYTAGVVDRLADQFRQDCHAAIEYRPPGSGGGWQLVLPEGTTIDYRPGPGGLERIEVDQAGVAHRETYKLPGEMGVAVELEEDHDTTLVRLEIGPSDDAARPVAAQPVRIVAALALDHRFELREQRE